MDREEMLRRVGEREGEWDLVIIGGGATGVGCAVDAASRGYSVLLLEQFDFGKGTSSRSTKLVHGGVRYLAQGNISLVRDALRERGILLRNAPHLVRKQPFVVPAYSYWDKFFYGSGLKTYDLLSGKSGFGKSKMLSRDETVKRLPNVARKDLQGGILYYDGQFDDSRLLIELVKTAADHGAVVLNHARVFGFSKNTDGKIRRVSFSDEISGQVFSVDSKAVINAAGPFCDNVRKLDDQRTAPMIAPSRGVHLVFDRKFLPTDSALMIPKTSDGRVLFAIPWNGKAVFGTTDTPVESVEAEPRASEDEIDFILETAAEYLDDPPRREDIQSIFAGIRPLVRADNADSTAALARDHTIRIEDSGLLTITGGKWTTYRMMAEDAVDQAAESAGLPHRRSRTAGLRIHGYYEDVAELGELAPYGSDAACIRELIERDPALARPIHDDLSGTFAEVAWAVRNEMAMTLEDVLARRLGTLFLDAQGAIEAGPEVARSIAVELGRDEAWIDQQVSDFTAVAEGYLPHP